MAAWIRPPLRSLALLSVWAFACWVSLVVGGMPRSEETAGSLGAVTGGLLVSLFYAGPFFGFVLAFFQRGHQATGAAGLRLVLGSWLMTNALAHGLLGYEDAVLQDAIECPGMVVTRDRAWPFDGTVVLCNDGEWFAHD